MTTTEQTSRNKPVTLTIPANAARLAADELDKSARQARDFDAPVLAELLEQTADALHAAGWDFLR